MRNYPVNDLMTGPTGSLSQIVTFWPNSLGFRQVYRFLMADGGNGERLSGSLRVRILQSTLDDMFELDINGKKIAPGNVRREFVPDDDLPAVWYEAQLDDCPPFAGDNELGMTMTRSSQQRAGDRMPYMEELEVIVD